MRYLVFMVMLAALSACQSAVELAGIDDAACQAMGTKIGSDSYVQCRIAKEQMRAAKAQSDAARTADILSSVKFTPMQMPAQQAPSSPQHCTSYMLGSTLHTDCN